MTFRSFLGQFFEMYLLRLLNSGTFLVSFNQKLSAWLSVTTSCRQLNHKWNNLINSAPSPLSPSINNHINKPLI